MKNKKISLIFSSVLILLAVTFTILVKTVDVKPVGANNTNIGFSGLNMFIFNAIGVNNLWYKITDLLGFVPIVIAISYVVIGIVQLIKRKSFLKIDKEIVILGIFYIVLVCIYVLFEKVVINFRPILIDGMLEASYPSSHTMLAVCFCGTSIILNKRLFNNKIAKVVNILSAVIIAITPVGRLLSGVHWFTDIVGGVIISAALIMSYFSAIQFVKHKDE